MFRQNKQLLLFETKFAQKRVFGLKFQNLSLDLESAPPRYHVSQFSVKVDNFELFALNLGKLPKYVQYFGSNTVEGIAESWVEVDGTGWSWMEVEGPWWRWAHGLVICTFKTP